MGKKAVKSLFQGIVALAYILLAILTIIAHFSAVSHPAEHPITSYLGTLLPGLLLVNLCFLIYWIISKSRLFFISIIVIGVNYSYLTKMIQFNSEKEKKESDITFVSYNVHGFNRDGMGITQRNILNELIEKEVDILCFQEFYANQYFTTDSLFQLFKAYPYHLLPKQKTGGTDIALFSKYPIKKSQYIPFENSTNSALWADIIVKGKTLRVYNLHLETTDVSKYRHNMSNRKTAGDAGKKRALIVKMNKGMVSKSIQRVEQAQKIQQIIEKTPMPTVLCGDFNDTPASYTYTVLKKDLIDGFRTNGYGYGGTYRGLLHLLRIDYIFYSTDFEGISYASPNLSYSDHKPIIMRLHFKP